MGTELKVPATGSIHHSSKTKYTSRRVVMVIQARMGSTRLPGKSMMDLAGAPLIGRLLERVKRCKQVDQIILATTFKEEDEIKDNETNKKSD